MLKKEKRLSQSQARFFAAEIVRIIETLSEEGISHNDLKPENLMLDENRHLKAIDFGTASVFLRPGKNNTLFSRFKSILKKVRDKNKTGSMQSFSQEDPSFFRKAYSFDLDSGTQRVTHKFHDQVEGTTLYLSPEGIRGYKGLSNDIWALGVILFRMLTGTFPFQAENEFSLYEKIRKAEVRFPRHLSNRAVNLFKRLFTPNPFERLGCGYTETSDLSALKRHPFFQKLDFSILRECETPFALKTRTFVQGLSKFQIFFPIETPIALEGKVETRHWLLFKRSKKVVLYKSGHLEIIGEKGCEEKLNLKNTLQISRSRNQLIITTSEKSVRFKCIDITGRKLLDAIKKYVC